MRQRIRQCRAAPTTGVGWARAILFCLRKRLLPAYDLSKRLGKPPAIGTARPAMQICRELGGYRLMDDRSGGGVTTPALLLDNVVKTYGAVRGVSLVAGPGEFIALLGPNGAGKSTLFQLLSGLFVPDSGRIEVMGHDMTRDAVPALARLGIVFQQPTLDLELSVTANLLFH